MLSSLLAEVIDFLKVALDKTLVGFVYGLGAVLGAHAAQFLLLHLLGVTVTLPL